MQLANLEILLTESTASPEQLVAQYQPTIETIQALKERSAEFYSTDPDEAFRIAEIAHKLSQFLPSPAPALGAWTLANANVTQDHFRDAATLFEEARKLYRDEGNTLDAARMCVGYVSVLAFVGKIERALELATECEPVLRISSAQEPADLQRLNNLLMNVGIVYELQGAYEDSLAVYNQQIQIAQELDDQVMLGQLQQNKGYTLIHLNAFDEALAAFEIAEQICLENALSLELVRIYTNQAILFTKLHQYESTKEALAKAAALLPKLGNGNGAEHEQKHLLTIWDGMLRIQMRDNVDEQLISSLHLAQKAFEQNGPLELEKLAWITLGNCYLERQDWADSANAFRAALDLNKEEQDTLIAFQSWYGLARLAEGQNQIDESSRYYNRAIDLIESVREDIDTDLYRAGFLTDKLTVYHDLANLHISSGSVEQALYVTERAKARVIAERFLSSIENQPSTDLSEQNRANLPAPELREKLNALERLYHDAELQENGSLDEQIAQVESEANQLAHAPQHKQNRSLNSAADIPIDLKQIQQHLADQTLLYYHIIREEVWVFVINHSGIKEHIYVAQVFEIQASQMALTQSIDRALEMSVHFGLERANRNASALIADSNKHLAALYRQLIQPVANQLIDEQPLYISTDGPLHAIPFHALYDGSQYLIEQHAISYVPSLTVFTLCMQPQVEQAMPYQDAQEQSVLLFGYSNNDSEEEEEVVLEKNRDGFSVERPDLFSVSTLSVTLPLTLRRNEHQFLPAVESELNWLQQLFPTAECYRGRQATTAQFLNTAPHSRLLHFAAHAHFRTDKPMLSAFTLADRRLTLAEINALQLNADLVVLSGCETTYGEVRGTDLLSLAGGFLSAGARSLLVSLWSVEDGLTAKLMAEFYHALRAGESRGASLRKAQCAILTAARKSPECALYAHPAYWAPFTLIGNAEPLEFETNFEI